jgi:hypothetical protein
MHKASYYKQYSQTFNPTYICGDDNRGVVHEYLPDGITLDYICVYESIGFLHYTAKNYLSEPYCELMLYREKENQHGYISFNELLVDKITPKNLIEKMNLYLLFS